MQKRLIEFGIAAGSFLATALVGAVLSDEFQAIVVAFGVPTAVVSTVALALAEILKAYLNSRKVAQLARNKGAPVTSAEARREVDLY